MAGRLTDAGGGRLARCCDRIPAHFLSANTPVPISPSRLRVTNGWLVSNGVTLAAVYAGAEGNDSFVGAFGIVRQNLVFGYQTEKIVTVGRTGPVMITQAPRGAAVETSAQHADLSFSSSTGTGGVLRLATDAPWFTP